VICMGTSTQGDDLFTAVVVFYCKTKETAYTYPTSLTTLYYRNFSFLDCKCTLTDEP